MIDDASIFLQNSTVTRKYKLVLSGIDQLIAVAKAWLFAICEDRWVRMRMPHGREWAAPLHPDWSLEDVKDILGKLLDLKNAYKQFASRPDQSYATVVAAMDKASNDVKYFLPPYPPFRRDGGRVWL